MRLSPAERVLLLNLLPPAEGNALLLRGVRRLRHALSFSPEEITRWSVTQVPASAGIQLRWDDVRATSEDIEMTGPVLSYVSHVLKSVELDGRLPEGLLDVFDAIEAQ